MTTLLVFRNEMDKNKNQIKAGYDFFFKRSHFYIIPAHNRNKRKTVFLFCFETDFFGSVNLLLIPTKILSGIWDEKFSQNTKSVNIQVGFFQPPELVWTIGTTALYDYIEQGYVPQHCTHIQNSRYTKAHVNKTILKPLQQWIRVRNWLMECVEEIIGLEPPFLQQR